MKEQLGDCSPILSSEEDERGKETLYEEKGFSDQGLICGL